MLWSGGNITRLFGQAQGFTALETTDAGHIFNNAKIVTSVTEQIKATSPANRSLAPGLFVFPKTNASGILV